MENPILSSTLLNYDLAEIYEWAPKWLVTFNPNKTESVLFSQKVYKPDNPSLYMIDQVINEMTYHKHLGLILSNDISWHEHLDYIKTKAWSLINIMRKLKFQLDRKSLQVIYMSFIRPLLEYVNVLWDNCAQYEINEIEKYNMRPLALLQVHQSYYQSKLY